MYHGRVLVRGVTIFETDTTTAKFRNSHGLATLNGRDADLTTSDRRLTTGSVQITEIYKSLQGESTHRDFPASLCA